MTARPFSELPVQFLCKAFLLFLAADVGGALLMRFLRLSGGVWEVFVDVLSISIVVLPPLFMRSVREAEVRAEGEAALALMRSRQDLILDSVADGIYGIDMDGRTIFVNAASTALTGFLPAELLGKSTHEIFHHTRCDGRPYPREECRIYATAHDGCRRFVDDEVFWRKDGTSFPVEYLCAPVRDGDAASGVVVVFRDVSERRRAQEEVHRLSQAVDQSPVLFFLVDLKGDIRFANPRFSRVTGYSREEAAGMSVLRLESEAVSDEHNRDAWAAVLSGQEWHGELACRRKDGESVWIAASIAPMCDAAGRRTHSMVVGEDVTERKRMEEELARAREKVKILNGILPICASCKKVRDDESSWSQVESYIAKHSEARFTHGICPDCVQKLYPDFASRSAGAS